MLAEISEFIVFEPPNEKKTFLAFVNTEKLNFNDILPSPVS